MFGKETCQRCGKKVSGSYDFCPKCGFKVNSKKEDYGMFGREDILENQRSSIEPEFKLPLGFNTIFNSLMKNFEKQLAELEKEGMFDENDLKNISRSPLNKGGSIKINIASFGNQPPKISVSTSGDFARENQMPQRVKKQSLKFKNK